MPKQKFIISNIYDFCVYHRPFMLPLRSISQMFYKYGSMKYLALHNIEVVSMVDFLDDNTYKYEIMDYNTHTKHYVDETIDSNKALEKFCAASNKLFEQIKTSDDYNNAVIFGIQPLGFSHLFSPQNYALIKMRNIKVIIFLDDPHGFVKYFRSGINVLTEPDIKNLQFIDHRMNNCDLFVSHGVPFLEKVGSYTNKLRLYFTPIDDIIFSFCSPDDFFNREQKILASGAIGGYPLRAYLANCLANKNHIANKYYDIIQHPGHAGVQIGPKTTGLYSYYIQLAKYQGAFSGYCSEPLNHIIYKTLEILVTGTILFSEDNDGLERLGLKKYVHYVPINKNNMFDEAYIHKYLGTKEGERIATNGYTFIKSYSNNRNNLNMFINILLSLSTEAYGYAKKHNLHIVFIDNSKIKYHKGHCYSINLANTLISSVKKYTLYENGVISTDIHTYTTIITDISQYALGQYNISNNVLYFSATDNSNPCTNQYTYYLIEDNALELTEPHTYVLDSTLITVCDSAHIHDMSTLDVIKPNFLQNPVQAQYKLATIHMSSTSELTTINTMYCYDLPSDMFGDTLDHPTRSKYLLYENDEPLAMPHSTRADIQRKGSGRYVHWHHHIYFSSSDNTNPITNSKIYKLVRLS